MVQQCQGAVQQETLELFTITLGNVAAHSHGCMGASTAMSAFGCSLHVCPLPSLNNGLVSIKNMCCTDALGYRCLVMGTFHAPNALHPAKWHMLKNFPSRTTACCSTFFAAVMHIRACTHTQTQHSMVKQSTHIAQLGDAEHTHARTCVRAYIACNIVSCKNSLYLDAALVAQGSGFGSFTNQANCGLRVKFMNFFSLEPCLRRNLC